MSKALVAGIFLFAFLYSTGAQAQYTPARTVQPEKSLLFAKQPDSFTVNSALLEKLFSLPPGEKVQLPVEGGEALQGTVTETVLKNEHVRTVNIKATNYAGALMTISRISNTNQPDRYIGRIVNIKYGDAFLLKKANDQYTFSKVKQSHLVTE